MGDFGIVVLTAGHITAGSVTVTPSATPSDGLARVVRTQQGHLGKTPMIEGLRPIAAVDDDLVITLDPSDKAGHKLHWTSYE